MAGGWETRQISSHPLGFCKSALKKNLIAVEVAHDPMECFIQRFDSPLSRLSVAGKSGFPKNEKKGDSNEGEKNQNARPGDRRLRRSRH